MYRLSVNSNTILNGPISFVSGCGNTEDLEYQAWLAKGGIPEPAETPEETILRDQHEISIAAKRWLDENDWKYHQFTRRKGRGTLTTKQETDYAGFLDEAHAKAQLIQED